MARATWEGTEAAYRWNNRENPYWFRDVILRLVEGDAMPYAELVAPKAT